MSRSIISKESIMLGSGNVYFLDAASGNYPEINSIATKANLLSRMDNVRINIKRELVTTKQLVNGIIHDKNSEVKGIEHFITFDYYEVNAKSLSVMHGGSLVDVAVVLSSLTKSPKKIRIEVEFLLPVGDKKLWYIFPKCVAASDLDMAPTNTEGATTSGTCLYNNNAGALTYAVQAGVGETIGANGVASYVHGSGYIYNHIYAPRTMAGYNIISFRWVNGKAELYINGEFIAYSTQTYGALVRNYNLGIGTYGSFTGYVAFHQIIDEYMHINELQRLEGWIAKKFGVSSKLADNHKFKWV